MSDVNFSSADQKITVLSGQTSWTDVSSDHVTGTGGSSTGVAVTLLTSGITIAGVYWYLFEGVAIPANGVTGTVAFYDNGTIISAPVTSRTFTRGSQANTFSIVTSLRYTLVAGHTITAQLTSSGATSTIGQCSLMTLKV
jgi:hypothetical protein